MHLKHTHWNKYNITININILTDYELCDCELEAAGVAADVLV